MAIEIILMTLERESEMLYFEEFSMIVWENNKLMKLLNDGTIKK